MLPFDSNYHLIVFLVLVQFFLFVAVLLVLVTVIYRKDRLKDRFTHEISASTRAEMEQLVSELEYKTEQLIGRMEKKRAELESFSGTVHNAGTGEKTFKKSAEQETAGCPAMSSEERLVLEMHDGGASIVEISRQMGKPPQDVEFILKIAGMKNGFTGS